MRENNKEMAIVRIGNDIGITWSFFQTQPGVSWKVPFDLTNLDLSLTLFSPLTGDVAIHDFSVTDNSLHWVFKGKDQSKLGKYTLTLTVNKGQDNQHVVDRIEFLELVSRSNSGVIRHGCAHGDRSVLDTECIALGTVVDYGYETVAHAMMTYARKEDMEAMMRNAYLAISRKAEALFRVDYDALDEDYARDYFEHRAPALNAGGCSVVAHGGLVGRNMDWLKRHPDGSVDAVFEVHTSAAQGRYASFGFAGSLAELSVEKVESREYSDAYRLLPYYLQDGVNEKGMLAAILVVPATSSRVAVPEVEKRDRVCSLALVRYILDHYQSVDEAVNSLRDYVEIFHPASLTAMGYEPHFFLKDSTKSVVLEFSGTGLVAVEINAGTNFHLQGVSFNADGTVWTNADVLDGHLPSSQGIENYGSGLERFNTIVTAAPESKEDMRELLDSILFSKAYTLTEGVWNSEFVGGNITVDTPADDQALLARLEEYRQKYADDADDVWITKQSVIYDLANFSASLTVFEGGEEYEAALDQNENVATKEFVEERVSNFITRSVNDLVNYYLKSDTYTKAEVQALISAVQQFTYEVLPVLPDASASTMHKIYLVPSSGPKAQNVKDEFITIDNGTSAETRYTWEQIGSTTIDLSNYPTFAQMTSAINAALAGYVTTSALILLLAGKQDALNATQLAAVNSGITSGKVAEIDGKYVKPQTGIPSTDMTTEVQTTLGKVTELEQEVNDLAELSPIVLSGTTMTSEQFDELWETEKTALIDVDEGSQMFSCFAKESLLFARPSSQGLIEGKGILLYYWNNANQIVKITCERVNGETEVTVTITVHKDLADFLTSDKIATTINHQSVNTKVAGALATYQAIHPAFVASIPASGAESNKVYRLGTVTGAVVISLATPADNTVDNYWHFTFTTDANITSVTWPSTMNGWVGNCLEDGEPKIVTSKHYEVDIDIEGYGYITEF